MNKKAVKKWAFYAGFGLLAMLLQEHLLSGLKIRGVHPMLGGVLTAVIAMFEGGMGGAGFGLYIGILQDASIKGAEGYFPVIYLLGGVATGLICEYMFRKSLFTAFLWSLLITTITTLFYFLLFFMITGRAGISALWLTALPEIIYSALMLPFIYYPARHIANIK